MQIKFKTYSFKKKQTYPKYSIQQKSVIPFPF